MKLVVISDSYKSHAHSTALLIINLTIVLLSKLVV